MEHRAATSVTAGMLAIEAAILQELMTCTIFRSLQALLAALLTVCFPLM
jgi:hypothetical protein